MSNKRKRQKTMDDEASAELTTPKSANGGLLTPRTLFKRKDSKYTGYVRYVFVDNVKHGICVLCETKIGANNVKPIPMKSGNTSGIKHHYRSYHVSEYAMLFEENTPGPKQKTLEQVIPVEIEKKEEGEINMPRLFVCWTSYKNLPINFFDDQVSQNFFKLLNPELEYYQRNVLADLLLSHFAEMQQNLKSILSKVESKMAFTIDAWWALTKASYYAITVHFIDNEWDLIATVLNITPAEGKHTGRAIADIFHGALEFFEITEKLHGKKLIFIISILNKILNKIIERLILCFEYYYD